MFGNGLRPMPSLRPHSLAEALAASGARHADALGADPHGQQLPTLRDLAQQGGSVMESLANNYAALRAFHGRTQGTVFPPHPLAVAAGAPMPMATMPSSLVHGHAPAVPAAQMGARALAGLVKPVVSPAPLPAANPPAVPARAPSPELRHSVPAAPSPAPTPPVMHPVDRALDHALADEESEHHSARQPRNEVGHFDGPPREPGGL